MAWSLILGFDSDDEEFVRGFEAGRIWTLMEESPEKLPGLIFHATNVEMIMRMLEAKELKLKAEFTSDETWMSLVEIT